MTIAIETGLRRRRISGKVENVIGIARIVDKIQLLQAGEIPQEFCISFRYRILPHALDPQTLMRRSRRPTSIHESIHERWPIRTRVIQQRDILHCPGVKRKIELLAVKGIQILQRQLLNC